MFDEENEDDWLAPDMKKQLDQFEEMYSTNQYSYLDSEYIEFIIDHLVMFNKLKRAKWAAERALEHFPSNTMITIKYAQILSITGRLNRALDILLKIEHIEAFNVELLLAIANCYSQLKDRKLAIRYFKRAFQLTMGEEKIDIAIDLAIELENNGDYKTAINVLQETVNEGLISDLLIYELAHCYEKVNDYKNAEKCFLQYIEEEPYSYTTWYNLGNVYIKMNQFDKAIWAYEYSILINESFIPAIYNLANTFLDDNQVGKALEQYKKCIELDKDDPIVYCSIGECFEELGELEDAYKMYCKSTDLMTQFSEAWVGRSIVSDLLGYHDRAINEVKTAIKIESKNAEYWKVLANIYEKNDEQKLLANEAYEMALAIDPENEEIIIDYLAFLGEMSIDLVYRVIENNYLEDNLAAKLAICYCQWKNGNDLDSMLIFEELMAEAPQFAKKLFYYFPEMNVINYYNDRLQEFDENYEDEEF